MIPNENVPKKRGSPKSHIYFTKGLSTKKKHPAFLGYPHDELEPQDKQIDSNQWILTIESNRHDRKIWEDQTSWKPINVPFVTGLVGKKCNIIQEQHIFGRKNTSKPWFPVNICP